jgi:hypothetical protein
VTPTTGATDTVGAVSAGPHAASSTPEGAVVRDPARMILSRPARSSRIFARNCHEACCR